MRKEIYERPATDPKAIEKGAKGDIHRADTGITKAT